MMIYGDVAIGLPIAVLAVCIIAIALASAAATYTGVDGSEARLLSEYSISQQAIAGIIAAGGGGDAEALVRNLSDAYGVPMALQSYTGNACQYASVCRMVSVDGALRVLVVG